MKRFITILIIFFTISAPAQVRDDDFFSYAQLFFSQYVIKGKVDYEAVKNDTALVSKLVSQIELFNPRSSGKNTREAFYLNAYNILVIKSVADNYPVKSSLDIKGFFDSQRHTIAGEHLTFNQIEKTKLINEYNDPRIHFWLISAATGSPVINNEAVRMNNLNELLDEQVKQAMNSNDFIFTDESHKEASLPMIFKLNNSEFIRDGKTILDFINSYRRRKIPVDYKLSYYAFNWDLNDRKDDPVIKKTIAAVSVPVSKTAKADTAGKTPLSQPREKTKSADSVSTTQNAQLPKKDFFTNAQLFFSKYVVKGKVNYTAVKKDTTLLNDLLGGIESYNIRTAGKNARKAFYLNTYNILVIKSVADNYPVKSPMDIKGLFDIREHAVADEYLTLDKIVKIKMGKDDPRIFFWLVPAAAGSPALKSRPVTILNVDDLLNQQVKQTINNPDFVKADDVHKEVIVSMLFKEHEADFTRDGKSILDFINLYIKKKLPPDYKLSFTDFNWDLNDSKENTTEKNKKPETKPTDTVQVKAAEVIPIDKVEKPKPVKDSIQKQTPVTSEVGETKKVDDKISAEAEVQLKKNDFFINAQLLFSKYVIKGKVNYAAVKKDTALLNTLAREIESFNLRTGKNTREAFYLNAYNILVIKSVTNNYPVNSPLDIKGFFDVQKHAIAGELLTLDEIEKIKISNEYDDSRIHFWVIPAALGSPDINSRAVTLHDLDALLDEQVKQAMNNKDFITVNDIHKSVTLPTIFKLNESEFTRDGKTILDFINQYKKKKIPADYNTGFSIFNWDLNDTKKYIPAKNKEPEILQADSIFPVIPENSDSLFKADVARTLSDTSRFNDAIAASEDLLSEGSSFLTTGFQFRVLGSLNTQHAVYNNDLTRINNDFRSSFFNMNVQAWNRITSRINFGVQFSFRSLVISTVNSSPYETLTFSNKENSKVYFRDVTNAVKYLFYDGKYRIAVQSSLIVPVSKANVVSYGDNSLSDNGQTQWINQLFYIHKYSKYFTLNAELNATSRFNAAIAANRFIVRASLIPEFNLWFSRSFRFYAFGDLTPQLNHGVFSSFYFREGAGITLLSEKFFQFDFQYHYYALGKRTSASSAFVVGCRFNL